MAPLKCVLCERNHGQIIGVQEYIYIIGIQEYRTCLPLMQSNQLNDPVLSDLNRDQQKLIRWWGEQRQHGCKKSLLKTSFLVPYLSSLLSTVWFLLSTSLPFFTFEMRRAQGAWLFWVALEESKHYCKKSLLQTSLLVSISSTFNLLFSTFYISPFLYYGHEERKES